MFVKLKRWWFIVKVVVDAFGGDFAPTSVIKGCCLIQKQFPKINIILSGNKKQIKQTASKIGISVSSFEIIDAKDYISPENEKIYCNNEHCANFKKNL